MIKLFAEKVLLAEGWAKEKTLVIDKGVLRMLLTALWMALSALTA